MDNRVYPSIDILPKRYNKGLVSRWKTFYLAVYIRVVQGVRNERDERKLNIKITIKKSSYFLIIGIYIVIFYKYDR